MPSNGKPKQKPAKFSASARVTLTALGVMSFVGAWNMVARLENKAAQANALPSPPPQAVLPTITPTPTPTPWPTIPPLADLSPIPTLVPTFTTGDQLNLPDHQTVDIAPLQPGASALMALPTLAPLPPMPEPPPPPPPPPPMPVPAPGGQRSGGS